MIFIPKKSTVSAATTLYVLAVLFCPLLISAQRPSDEEPAALDQLVRGAVRNEIESQLRDESLWCYHQEHQEDGKGNQTLEVCQTNHGNLERTVALSGVDLSPTQQQAEDQRLLKLVHRPEQLKAKQKKEREDGEQARSLLRVFPDAFRFECESEAGEFVRIKFKPNPDFHPATRASMVFHHMEGYVVVDRTEKRIVEIDGQLTSEVKFGGGLLGHLDRGGTFHVKEQDVGSGHWEMTLMNVQMSGRVLFFKSIAVRERDIFTDYRPLPSGTSLEQVADFLRKDFNARTASSNSSLSR